MRGKRDDAREREMTVTLKIWGRLTSVNVQKVMFCVEYLAKNPNGLVPLIDDDGFLLWESNAIVRYLAGKHATGSMLPSDPQRRADADRWMDWQTTTLQPAMGGAFMNLVRLPPEKRDAAAVEPSRKRSEACVAILEGALARHQFVAGDSLTIGDISLGPAIHRWLNLPLDR